jgi:N-acetyl-beta-hexosaminidase
MSNDEMKSIIVYLTDKVTKLEQENIMLSNKNLCQCDEEEAPVSVKDNIINLFSNAEA